MTVKELIARLSELPEENQKLPVQLLFWIEDEGGESRRVAEVIDTVIPPQSWGLHKDSVTLTAWE